MAQLSLSKLPKITQSEPRQSSARTHTLNHDSAANPLRERPWSLMSNRDCERSDRQSKYRVVDCVGSESPDTVVAGYRSPGPDLRKVRMPAY